MTGAQENSNEPKRPLTADVKILSSQAWRQSFLGFVKVRVDIINFNFNLIYFIDQRICSDFIDVEFYLIILKA